MPEQRSKYTGGSLCWYCRKVGVRCKKPVEGWDADYNPIKGFEDQDIPSWFVRSCPKFEQDRREYQIIKGEIKTVRARKKQTEQGPNVARYDIFGERLTTREVCRMYGVKANTFRTRMSRGMTPEEAALGQRKDKYILVGSCVETGEVRQWLTVKEACNADLGFNPQGISASINHGMVHKGWIFEKKPI